MEALHQTVRRLAEALPVPITLVDVGCRWGFADTWLQFGEAAQIFGFDPDAEECRRLEERYRDHPGVRVVASALGAEPGAATLYVTKEPAAASLYPPAIRAIDRHPGLVGEQVERLETLELTTLDAWAAASGIESIDFVKLDTQGSELDVLRGATRLLTTVRAIECEVQFNELYEGVPLFGDVDRFLRAHGFVLWQLRNLAHHARGESRLDFAVPTSWHHDTVEARVDTKAGQLFWCDAFFVKDDVVEAPESVSGWTGFARDACVCLSLRLYDLAQIALDRVRAVAPPEPAARAGDVLAALEDMLANENRRRAERVEATRPPAPAVAAPPVSVWRLERDSVPLVGSFSLPIGGEFEGTGWGGVEDGVGPAWRWTGPGREAAIDLPLRVSPGARVELHVVAAREPARLGELALEVNGLPVPADLRRVSGGWTISGVIPGGYAPSRRFTRVLIRTSPTVPVDAPAPGGLTAQGVGVARLTLSAPEPA